MSRNVSCAVHGEQAAAFICTHLMDTLHDGFARGVNWSEDDKGEISAWCADCDEMLEAGGGEWTEALGKKAEIKLVCRQCFNRIQTINDEALIN